MNNFKTVVIKLFYHQTACFTKKYFYICHITIKKNGYRKIRQSGIVDVIRGFLFNKISRHSQQLT